MSGKRAKGPRKEPLTVYAIKERVDGEPVTEPEQVVDREAGAPGRFSGTRCREAAA